MRKSLVIFLLAMLPSIYVNAWVDTDMDGVPDKKDACNDTPEKTLVMANGCTDPDANQQQNMAKNDVIANTPATGEQVTAANTELVCNDSTKALQSGQFTSACLLERLQPIYFEFAKADVLLSQLPMLDVLNDIRLSDPNVTVSLIGHADLLGSDEINQALSFARAERVKSLLIKRFNFKPENISVKGMSNTQPAADNATIEGRQRNRRVEFIISAE